VQVWINGEQRELADGAFVRDALVAIGVPESGVAVAVDGEVVRRTDWTSAALADGARIEVLTAVQGG
jgi:sulfur carrier protein